MLHFGRGELTKAFWYLKAAAFEGLTRTQGRPAAESVLLALYAVECGLKCRLLKARGLHSTRDLAPDDGGEGEDGGDKRSVDEERRRGWLTHDINRLLETLRLPTRLAKFSDADRPRDTRPSAAQLHELYRYGGLLTRTDEQRLVRALRSILLDIEENLG